MSKEKSIKISQKQRVRLLLPATLIFIWVAWQLSFSKTYYAYSESRKNANKIAQSSTIDKEIAYLQQQLKNMEQDSLVKAFSQEQLFEIVTDWCQEQNISVRSMPEANIIENDGYKVFINTIEIEGIYHKMLELIYLLERKYKMGQVIHSDFRTLKNRETKKNELIATIHLQNIQPLSKK